MRRLLLVLPLALRLASAQQNPLQDPGFQHFYNLEFAEALATFEERAAKFPADPNPQNHIAQTLLYIEMLRNGALESEMVTGTNPFVRRPNLNVTPDVLRRFMDTIAHSMELSKAKLAVNPEDSRAHYTLGVAHGIRANWNFLVKKGWTDSLRDATEARKLANKAAELDPTFLDARFIQAAHDYIVGSLPFTYKILGFLVGFRGDRDEGIKVLQLVTEKGTLNRVDAAILLAAIYRREKRPLDAIPLLNDLIARFPRNYILRLEQSNMYSDAGDKANAIAQLDLLEQARAAHRLTLLPERIDSAKGNVYFWYNDLDLAVEHLTRASKKAASFDLNTGALTYMRLGQARDLKGLRDEAKTAYAAAIKLSPQSDLAKESKDYLNSPYRRKK